MSVSDQIRQNPAPGLRQVMFQGDTVCFFLELKTPLEGGAWLRNNIGRGNIIHEEIVRQIDYDEPRLGRDWFDIPMVRIDGQNFRLTLPLCEIGHFEAKCFFIPSGATDPMWPPGPNTVINVEPADTVCANTVYNAFVRQFGPNKSTKHHDETRDETITGLDKEGYAVIPPSGKFRDFIRDLDFIMGTLGCRVIQLLPIFPTPTTYARMGRFGSPYAALSFTAVDPALAVFDPAATPLEQFVELVDAVHFRNGKVIVDIAINHTGWAAGLHETHPEWLIRDSEGRIEVPGAWGIQWEDLTKLDYSYENLWRYMAEVFLTWCRRGVDGFRCDAGYMIPMTAWEYIIARVRTQYPNTIFLLEGLGGKIVVTRDLLNRANFNWGYSELFQNYDRHQVENYLNEALEISRTDGNLIHFAETHDNLRLAAKSNRYARMRTSLCALTSLQGGFGFANGVEWFAKEKINVHDSPSLNWGADDNQVSHISRLNRLLWEHPAFHHQVDVRFVHHGETDCIALLRRYRPTGKELLVLANLDDQNPVRCSWEKQSVWQGSALDLLTGEPIDIITESEQSFCLLAPGKVVCLSKTPEDRAFTSDIEKPFTGLPTPVLRQRLRTKVLEAVTFYHGLSDLEAFDVDQASHELIKDPLGFCRELNPLSDEPRVVTWQWPVDQRREVMLPPGHFLLIRADAPFRARLVQGNMTIGQEESFEQSAASYFALFKPVTVPMSQKSLFLQLSVFSQQTSHHIEAPLLLLPEARNVIVPMVYGRHGWEDQPAFMLGTNGRGAMMRAGQQWGALNSHYDALLAANLNPDCPEDRLILFTRCRAWVVFQGYSQAVNQDCLKDFRFDYDSTGYWRYLVPTGQGQHVEISITAKMAAGKNCVVLTFHRFSARGRKDLLPDKNPVRMVLRPDVENRNFHHTTKAYLGPESQWPNAVSCQKDSFSFQPEPDYRLNIRINPGDFHLEPEWQYMVGRPAEKDRGHDPNSDLFSPGYFTCDLKGKTSAVLTAQVVLSTEPLQGDEPAVAEDKLIPDVKETALPFDEALKRAMGQYVVKRGDLKSVIAGYPWFLDWGRDALIFVRGMIAAGFLDEARSVLKQFGSFEKNGTLPNMIQGDQAANRDTSDAPLWFVVACADLITTEDRSRFLEELWGGRTIREILLSIGEHYISGTPNGIKMDSDSGLIYSPSHFTWMDTNHPAGTPREGYPIEIQALWYGAVSFLSKITVNKQSLKWKTLAEKVGSAIHELFFLEAQGYLADCRRTKPGIGASQAVVDDALRSNQLMAVTMGAIRDLKTARRIVTSCEALIVPGAIRSLSDQPVNYPLEITHQGQVLNDPLNPYQGRYVGDEDTQRKPAYHNGTAWTWPFASFCEAWARAYGRAGYRTAQAILASGVRWINQGCVGHLPEILDGDYPHTPRGCDAQAWGASEVVRVWQLLSSVADDDV